MPFQIIRNDITKVKADIIVNTANPEPIVGGGTDRAIYEAAGEELVLSKRREIGAISRGEIGVTPAFNLDAKYIIHTVGPIWEGGGRGEFDILRSCYKKSLEKAAELGAESIAFPLIATGVYSFPKDRALSIAISEITDFLMRDDVEMMVFLVVFDDTAFRLSKTLFDEVESYIDDKAVIKAHREEYYRDSERRDRSAKSRPSFFSAMNRGSAKSEKKTEALSECTQLFLGALYDAEEVPLEQALEEAAPTDKLQAPVAPNAAMPKHSVMGAPFNEHTFDKDLFMSDGKAEFIFRDHLIKVMNEKDVENPVVYKRSNVTKGAFSKILSGDTKIPKKETVLAFCIGLQLNKREADRMLACADMAFNPYDKRDRLVIKCIEHGQYNINEVNAMLYICKLPLLGNLG